MPVCFETGNRGRKREVAKLNLTELVRFISSEYGRDKDVFTILRGAACQALYYNNNTKARNAALEGAMKDMAFGWYCLQLGVVSHLYFLTQGKSACGLLLETFLASLGLSPE